MAASKSTKPKPGARAYAATVRVPGIDPRVYDVSAVVLRHDNKPLSATELGDVRKAIRAPAKPQAVPPTEITAPFPWDHLRLRISVERSDGTPVTPLDLVELSRFTRLLGLPISTTPTRRLAPAKPRRNATPEQVVFARREREAMERARARRLAKAAERTASQTKAPR